jgi:hypothetical protein
MAGSSSAELRSFVAGSFDLPDGFPAGSGLRAFSGNLIIFQIHLQIGPGQARSGREEARGAFESMEVMISPARELLAHLRLLEREIAYDAEFDRLFAAVGGAEGWMDLPSE